MSTDNTRVMLKPIKRFDKPPVLWCKDYGDVQLFMAAIKLANETAVKRWIDMFDGKILSKIGLEILEIWSGSREILASIARKIELDDLSFAHLSKTEDSHARLQFVKRGDLSSAQLEILAGSYLPAPGRTEIAMSILEHQNLTTNVLIEMWAVAPTLRTFLLRRPNLPRDFQQYIADNGDYVEKIDLLKQANTDNELRKALAASFAAKNCEYTQADLLLHCEIQQELILAHAFSSDIRLATLAADRLSEVASILKIRYYVHWHAGFRYAPIQNLVAEFIRDGLPLGWFVCACFVLKRIITNDPETFYKLLLWVKSEPRTAGIQSIGYSSEKDIHSLDRLLDSLTPDQKARLGTKTLQMGDFNSDVLRSFRAINEGYDAGFKLDQSAIRRTMCLSSFVEEYKHQFNVSREENVNFRPSRRPYWTWLSRLDKQLLSTDHRIKVVRSSRSLRRLGANLRNCLNREYDIHRIRRGKTIILSLQRDNRDVYAVEIQTADAGISQFHGIHNSIVPDEVKDAFQLALSVARIEADLPPESKASSDNKRLHGILQDHVI